MFLVVIVSSQVQGEVTPIDAVVVDATGVTMRSQGHGVFFAGQIVTPVTPATIYTASMDVTTP